MPSSKTRAASGDPVVSRQNAESLFAGIDHSWVRDFCSPTRRHRSYCCADPINHEVVFPVINGQELNNEPDQKA